MKIKVIWEGRDQIQYKVFFRDGTIIYREIQRYVYAIHRHSTKIKHLKTKSIHLKTW